MNNSWNLFLIIQGCKYKCISREKFLW